MEINQVLQSFMSLIILLCTQRCIDVSMLIKCYMVNLRLTNPRAKILIIYRAPKYKDVDGVLVRSKWKRDCKRLGEREACPIYRWLLQVPKPLAVDLKVVKLMYWRMRRNYNDETLEIFDGLSTRDPVLFNELFSESLNIAVVSSSSVILVVIRYPHDISYHHPALRCPVVRNGNCHILNIKYFDSSLLWLLLF